MTPVSRASARQGGKTEPGRLAAQQGGHPLKPAEEPCPRLRITAADTQPMRQRIISRLDSPWPVRRATRPWSVVAAHADQDDAPQRVVGLAVAA
jgi:hypothetical protein